MKTYVIQKYQKLVWILIHLKPKGWSCLNVIHVKQLFKTKNGLPISCEFMHFPTKNPSSQWSCSRLIILIHASQFPCDHSHHWNPSNHSYPSHLSIRDSNGIDPTTLILQPIIMMAMVFMFFLTKSLSCAQAISVEL